MANRLFSTSQTCCGIFAPRVIAWVAITRAEATLQTKKPQHCWGLGRPAFLRKTVKWRGQDLNLRPRGYEPRELPGCSTPRQFVAVDRGSISVDYQKGSQLFPEFANFVRLSPDFSLKPVKARPCDVSCCPRYQTLAQLSSITTIATSFRKLSEDSFQPI